MHNGIFSNARQCKNITHLVVVSPPKYLEVLKQQEETKLIESVTEEDLKNIANDPPEVKNTL